MSFGEKERTLEELSGLIEEGQVDQGALCCLPMLRLMNKVEYISSINFFAKLISFGR